MIYLSKQTIGMYKEEDGQLGMLELLWVVGETDVTRLTLMGRHPNNPAFGIYINHSTQMPVRVFLQDAQREIGYAHSEYSAKAQLRKKLLLAIDMLDVVRDNRGSLPIEVRDKVKDWGEIFDFRVGLSLGHKIDFNRVYEKPPDYMIVDTRTGNVVDGVILAVTTTGFRVMRPLDFPVKILFA